MITTLSRTGCGLTMISVYMVAGSVWADKTKPAEQDTTSMNTPRHTALTQGITSFGAAVIEHWVYVYGGHLGQAHHYHNTSQSNQLSRLDLRSPSAWEVVGTGPRLQGLAMVAHDGMLYRLGGFTARNEQDADHDLLSVADCARFDPRTMSWTELTPMPEPRSSFDAVVVDDMLYVVGGWQLGDGAPRWHETAYRADLSQKALVWQPLPKPNFKRRALSLGHLDGTIYAIGGMDSDNDPTTRVDMFDPITAKWSTGPAMPGEGMEGFGSSAFNARGRLFVSTYGGHLLSLDPGQPEWRTLKTLDDDRFFHRMLPYENDLLIFGGASMTDGKRLDVEVVELDQVK